MSKSHPGLPIPDDWNGTDWCHFAICWPDSLQWRAILAGFITTPMLGRTWDGATGTITDVQQIGREIFESNLDWRYCLMSTCSESTTDFIAAIRYLADKIGVSGCCGNPGTVGGPGTGGAGPTPQDPGEPVVENTPPAGFDTWQEYKDYQCAVLSWLLDTIGTDLTTLSTIQLAGATVVAILPVLAATLLDPIPGDELFLLAGVLAGIAFYGATALSETTSVFATAKQDMLCAMYNNLDPEGARSDALAVFNDQMDLDATTTLIAAWGKLVMGYMLSVNGVNKAYALDPTRTYPTADCSGCVQAEFDLTAQQYYDGTYHAVSITSEGDGVYSVEPLTAHTVDGIANSVVLEWNVTDYTLPDRFTVEGVTWPSFAGNAGPPGELKAWTRTQGGSMTLVVDTSCQTLQEVMNNLNTVGHLYQVQIWSIGGSESGIEIQILHDDL